MNSRAHAHERAQASSVDFDGSEPMLVDVDMGPFRRLPAETARDEPDSEPALEPAAAAAAAAEPALVLADPPPELLPALQRFCIIRIRPRARNQERWALVAAHATIAGALQQYCAECCWFRASPSQDSFWLVQAPDPWVLLRTHFENFPRVSFFQGFANEHDLRPRSDFAGLAGFADAALVTEVFQALAAAFADTVLNYRQLCARGCLGLESRNRFRASLRLVIKHAPDGWRIRFAR